MPDFNPDQFLAETTPKAEGFDPDKFLSDTQAPADTSHDLIPFLKEQGKGFVDLAKKAGSGLVDAAMHPVQTASDVASSLASSPEEYGEGIYRAVRNTPVVGNAINMANIAAKGIPAYLHGGDDAALQAVNAQDDYEQAQNEKDVSHVKEHPLTDFIQKSAGMAALPEGHIAQTSALAIDAFSKSLAQGNDVTTALKDARNTAVLAATALKTGQMASNVPRVLGKYAAREAGVTDNAIARYRENPEAVNAASQYVKEPEALKNLVDEQVAPINKAAETADQGYQDARDAVADTKAPPISLASEIPEHLDTQGEKLHDLSSQAFDILDKEGRSFPVEDLSNSVQKQMQGLEIGGVVPSIGPDAAAHGSLGKFNDMLNQIGSNTEDGQIPAPVVKKLIQQLDGVSKDAYTTNAGALSPAAAKNLAAVRRSFDAAIKDASPAYAEKMSELSPQVGLVSDMSNMFGNEPMALNALKAAADPMTPRGYIVRKKLGEYDAMNGTDFAQRVSDYYDLPKQNLQQARQTLLDTKDQASAVNKIGANSTETAIPRIQMGHNFEARKQLENLNPDLAQTVQDTGVARQFAKATTNGSRKAKIGAGIGGAAGAAFGGFSTGPVGAVVGGHIGSAVGGFAGGLADLYGGQAVKAALDAGIALDKIANTPYIKPLMEAAQKSPRELAIAHYMLSQKDPQYQALNAPSK